jgi:hypothetical protein
MLDVYASATDEEPTATIMLGKIPAYKADDPDAAPRYTKAFFNADWVDKFTTVNLVGGGAKVGAGLSSVGLTHGTRIRLGRHPQRTHGPNSFVAVIVGEAEPLPPKGKRVWKPRPQKQLSSRSVDQHQQQASEAVGEAEESPSVTIEVPAPPAAAPLPPSAAPAPPSAAPAPPTATPAPPHTAPYPAQFHYYNQQLQQPLISSRRHPNFQPRPTPSQSSAPASPHTSTFAPSSSTFGQPPSSTFGPPPSSTFGPPSSTFVPLGPPTSFGPPAWAQVTYAPQVPMTTTTLDLVEHLSTQRKELLGKRKRLDDEIAKVEAALKSACMSMHTA